MFLGMNYSTIQLIKINIQTSRKNAKIELKTIKNFRLDNHFLE